ncbi:FMN-binding negative transcriptional regulator [Sphingobium sp. H39-3-25]|uniref:FMN-binding negative transcriptional regulator n=1 Tax=Sphingobium arseniciresistens TaxID=3030834 RepID=UPI0023B8AF82|nr:FMN-binding negative transcriptional regulator [Sphingobium arseniciresistens]
MHPDPRFHWKDRDAMRAFVAARGFGMVFAGTPQGSRVAHVAAVWLDEDRLGFHLANANALTPALHGAQALFVAQGEDGYVSPDWYGLDDQVPTWNYRAVELSGTVAPLDGAETAGLLDRLSADREARLSPKPAWTRAKMTPGKFERMLGAITGFALTVTQWRGTAKFGQDKPAAARLAVADALEGVGNAPTAATMREGTR